MLPHGVLWRELKTHADHRGELTELFRAEWQDGPAPVQWNFVRSQKNVLRGVHVHPRHDDYLIVLENRMVLGLKDLRRDSPTHGCVSMIELNGERLSAIHIPHGVAHGFYVPSDALYVYAVSSYWDVLDELRCRWDDPELGLRWPTDSPALSDADTTAGTLSAMRRDLEARMRIAPSPR
ncbi:MAG TPA: dTDP-4-dehydrorhamnose 3,5-epimerase family protein [Methylomirabilota bacterium]|jgi:dTDP-4-dehydrorhamnose 3,5-epimerase|nr:dTDP-4-dehydrorhamnose 3,5-epimerase family protein [Methylomirabilota bacterium]